MMTRSIGMSKKGWRANVIWFPDPSKAELSFLQDGLVVTARAADGIVRVEALGPFIDLHESYPNLEITHWPGFCIAPGFVDLHVHYSQTDVIASPADGLLPWLERYTFPHEMKFSDVNYARTVAHFFLDELTRNG